MEQTPHVLASDDPMRPFYVDLRQGLLVQLNALDRLLGIPTPPPRRRGRDTGNIRVWHTDDEDRRETA